MVCVLSANINCHRQMLWGWTFSRACGWYEWKINVLCSQSQVLWKPFFCLFLLLVCCCRLMHYLFQVLCLLVCVCTQARWHTQCLCLPLSLTLTHTHILCARAVCLSHSFLHAAHTHMSARSLSARVCVSFSRTQAYTDGQRVRTHVCMCSVWECMRDRHRVRVCVWEWVREGDGDIVSVLCTHTHTHARTHTVLLHSLARTHTHLHILWIINVSRTVSCNITYTFCTNSIIQEAPRLTPLLALKLCRRERVLWLNAS